MNIRNECRFIGNTSKDVELRYTTTGVPMVTFSLAVNSPRKEDDEWEQDTVWVPLVAFGPSAESIAKHVRKGYTLVVSCSYTVNETVGDDGEKVKFSNFKIHEWQILRRPNKVVQPIEQEKDNLNYDVY